MCQRSCMRSVLTNTLMKWHSDVAECTFSEFEGNRKFGGVVCSNSDTVVQRPWEAGGTDWQESKKGEQGEMHSPARGLLVAQRLGSSFAEKDLGLLVDSKLNMRQQHRRLAASRAASGRALAAGQCQQGEDPSFPLATSGVPCVQLPSTRSLTFKTWQDNLLYLTLLELGIGPDNLQRCLPASTILWVCRICFLPVKWAGIYFGQKQVIESYLKLI